MDNEALKEILSALSQGGWAQASIVTKDFNLSVGTGAAPLPAPAVPVGEQSTPAAAAPAPVAPAPAPVPAPAPEPTVGTTISAPSVGVTWRAPKPGAAPFIEVGQTIAAGDTVFLLEVMKLFSPIISEVSGVVTRILVEDGQMVEYGTPLVVVEAA